jgi:hypothetical protein
MTGDDDLRVRIGRVRSRGRLDTRPFNTQALVAAQKAGGLRSRSGRSGRSTFGRGRTASVLATRLQNDRSRGAMVKARVVRHGIKRAPLSVRLESSGIDRISCDSKEAA